MPVPHIVQNGSRSHVISWVRTWRGAVRVCSCQDCEVNDWFNGSNPLSRRARADLVAEAQELNMGYSTHNPDRKEAGE